MESIRHDGLATTSTSRTLAFLFYMACTALFGGCSAELDPVKQLSSHSPDSLCGEASTPVIKDTVPWADDTINYTVTSLSFTVPDSMERMVLDEKTGKYYFVYPYRGKVRLEREDGKQWMVSVNESVLSIVDGLLYTFQYVSANRGGAKQLVTQYELGHDYLRVLDTMSGWASEGGPGPEWNFKSPGHYLPNEMTPRFSACGDSMATISYEMVGDKFIPQLNFFDYASGRKLGEAAIDLEISPVEIKLEKDHLLVYGWMEDLPVYLARFDFNGKRIWRRKIGYIFNDLNGASHTGIQYSKDKSKLYVGKHVNHLSHTPRSSELICLDPMTGETEWEINFDNILLPGDLGFDECNARDIFDFFVTADDQLFFLVYDQNWNAHNNSTPKRNFFAVLNSSGEMVNAIPLERSIGWGSRYLMRQFDHGFELIVKGECIRIETKPSP